MPGSDTKNLTEVEKWKIYAEMCKWTDQKTGKIVNNGIERIIEGVKVENIKVKERTVKKIKQAVDEFRRQGKPADLSQKGHLFLDKYAFFVISIYGPLY